MSYWEYTLLLNPQTEIPVNKHKTLVIVESPTKAKTVSRIIGKDYTVLASFGHVFELIPKNGAVETDNHFHMNYQPIEKNKKHLDRIISVAKQSDAIILATDPDREGEAIAAHIADYIVEKKANQKENIKRSSFHQITKKAIVDAINSPKELNQDLIDAQHGRRAMDYLIGFNISPLMWRIIKPGTSAGRVQSPALHCLVSREKERTAFVSQEYWSISSDMMIGKSNIQTSLFAMNGEKLDKFAIDSDKKAQEITQQIESAKKVSISDIQSKNRSRNPKAPFTTSTLQQEASNKLGFPTSKTMKIAQELYEGIDIKDQHLGLITYMRTDSVTIAQEALPEIRSTIEKSYGSDFLPKEIQTYKTKTKNAQEAHEAIRPTDFSLSPDAIKSHLSADQYKLYQLIFARTLASQMVPAKLDQTTIIVDCDTFQFKATGSVIKHPGFLKAYQDDEKNEQKLPAVSSDDKVTIESVTPAQHFTEPPPRYTEASLVKILEELGIGRPSTYASIISTLKKRNYVSLEGRQFVPSDIGDVVDKFLSLYFSKYIDDQFTAKMEDALDEISRGELDKESLLTTFWSELKQQIDTISNDVKRSDVTQEEIDEKCPECSANLVLKLGKHGKFIGCSQYPECKYTRPLNGDSQPTETIDKDCPKCQNPMVKKQSYTGGFLGCSNYPECKHIEPLPENITDTDCPKCKETKLIKRVSKRGKVFYGCPAYPTCKYAIWNPPVKRKCPACKWPIMTEKNLKKGLVVECPECKHKIEDDQSE